ncbi:serine hydrolase domain-containing protein [Cellvibrio sp.]|uniref:serine hydrolase domain-containing protein n=1 Tax=Cellvibrio sp. TaxID=1965322 RepID=UPI0039647EAF
MAANPASAQTDKQISYPVPIQAERAAASSSAPAAPVYKAPQPVIRPIEEASTTPPDTPKKSATKTTTQTTSKTVKTETPAKAVVKKTEKATTKADKKVVEKKSTATKTTAAKATTKPTTAAKATTTASVKKNTAQDTKPELEKAAPTLLAPAKPVENTPKVSTATKMAIAPVAAAGLAAADLSQGNELTEGTLDDEDFSGGGELTNEDAPVSATASSASVVKSTALPVGGPRERFVQEFKEYVETKLVPRVPGLAFAVIADGKVKVMQAYGVKKVGTKDPIDTDTAFRLASVSKTIAGTTAGVLVNDGLISWDTPITSVLPNVEFSNPRYGNQLTLRNIMSQSTGLPTHAGDNFIEEGLPYEAVLEKFKAVNFVCPPGKCYSYQNVTMSLLASIVQKKTGKPYEQYVKEKIFTPLGMRSASIGLEGLLATKNYALPHEVAGNGKWYTKEITQNYYRLNPAAGGNASVNDMARWILAHMGHNPEVLSPATLQAVHAKTTKNTPAQSHYGAREGVTDTYYAMGFRTFDYRGDKNFLHHGGYVFGSRSEMVFNPELQIGMVILSNCNRLPGSVIFEFLDAYEDEKRGEKRPSLVQAVKKKVSRNKKSPSK